MARWHEAPAATSAAGEGQSSVVELELGFEPTTFRLRIAARPSGEIGKACSESAARHPNIKPGQEFTGDS